MSFDVFICFAFVSPNYISKYKLRNTLMWRNDQSKLSLLLVTATSTMVTVT